MFDAQEYLTDVLRPNISEASGFDALYFDYVSTEMTNNQALLNEFSNFTDSALQVDGLFATFFKTLTVGTYGIRRYSDVFFDNAFTCNNMALVTSLIEGLRDGYNVSVECDGHTFEYNADLVMLCADCDRFGAVPVDDDECVSYEEAAYVPFNYNLVSEDCAGYRVVGYLTVETEYIAASSVPVIDAIVAEVSATDSITVNVSGTAVNPSAFIVCHAVDRELHDVGALSGYSAVQAVSDTYASHLFETSVDIIEQAFEVELTLMELSPATDYEIFCYGEDVLTNGMGDAAVLATGTTVATQCCREVSFYNVPSQRYGNFTHTQLLTTGDKDETTFLIGLDKPLTNENSYIVVRPFSGGGFNLDFTPSNITFTSSSPPAARFQLVGDIVPDPYTIRLELHLSSDLEDVYDDKKSQQTREVVTLLGQSKSPSPPKLDSAVFSYTGASVVAAFSHASDRASAYTSQTEAWACDELFDASGRDLGAYLCEWIDTKHVLLVAASPDDATLVPGDGLVLVGGRLTARRTLFFSDEYDTADEQSVVIALPTLVLQPDVVITAPALFPLCSGTVVSIDPSASSGSGGRAWTNVMWEVTPTNASSSASAANVRAFLETESTAKALRAVDVPTSLFNSTSGYQIRLTLTNFMGGTAVRAVDLVPSNETVVPSVVIGGNPLETMLASRKLTINAVGAPSQCVEAGTSLDYSWRVFKNFNLITTLVSTSVDVRVFQVPSYTLAVGATYTFVATVTSGSTSAIAKKTVTVVSAGLSADLNVISETNVDRSFVLDAGLSADLDTVATDHLAFTFICTVLTEGAADYGEDCTILAGLSSVAITTSTATVLANVLTEGGVYGFVVRVIDTTDESRYATAERLVTITAPATPSIALRGNLLLDRIYNVEDRVSIQASITVPVSGAGLSARWSTDELTDEELYERTIGNALSLSSVASVEYATFDFAITVGRSQLRAGRAYTFRLSASSSDLSSEMVVSIKMNAPPALGSFEVVPSSGVALATSFTSRASGWVDDDMPLTYAFAVNPTTGPQSTEINGEALSIRRASVLSTYSGSLPEGLASNAFSTRVFIKVTDTLDASAQAYDDVTVQPFLASGFGLSDVTGALEGAFNEQNGDAVDQIVVLSAAALNVVDCSGITDSDCTDLKRLPCGSNAHRRPNTCGSCLDGYTGSPVDFASECQEDGDDDRRRVLFSSLRDDETKTLANKHRRLSTTSKSCPTASPGDTCSGHGTCLSYHRNATVANTCLVSDTTCFALCACDTGYAGQACNLDEEMFLFATSYRLQMCTALVSSVAMNDVTTDFLLSSLTTFRNIFVVDEMDDAAFAACRPVLAYIVEWVAAGLLSGASTDAMDGPTSVLTVLSRSLAYYLTASATGAVLAIPTDEVSFLEEAVESLTAALAADMSEGQGRISVASDWIAVGVDNYRTDEFSRLGLLAAPTVAESFYGTSSFSVHLPSTGLRRCGIADDYATARVTSYVISPYGMGGDKAPGVYDYTGQVRTPAMSVELLGDATVASELVDLDDDDYSFNVTMQFDDPIMFFDDISYDHVVPALFSLEEDILGDGETWNTYLDRYCTLHSYTPYNASFVCMDVGMLCGVADGRRRLDRNTNRPDFDPELTSIHAFTGGWIVDPGPGPTSKPSGQPSGIPSSVPTGAPTNAPIITPRPTHVPTSIPTGPSGVPTNIPSIAPFAPPSKSPTFEVDESTFWEKLFLNDDMVVAGVFIGGIFVMFGLVYIFFKVPELIKKRHLKMERKRQILEEEKEREKMFDNVNPDDISLEDIYALRKPQAAKNKALVTMGENGDIFVHTNDDATLSTASGDDEYYEVEEQPSRRSAPTRKALMAGRGAGKVQSPKDGMQKVFKKRKERCVLGAPQAVVASASVSAALPDEKGVRFHLPSSSAQRRSRNITPRAGDTARSPSLQSTASGDERPGENSVRAVGRPKRSSPGVPHAIEEALLQQEKEILEAEEELVDAEMELEKQDDLLLSQEEAIFDRDAVIAAQEEEIRRQQVLLEELKSGRTMSASGSDEKKETKKNKERQVRSARRGVEDEHARERRYPRQDGPLEPTNMTKMLASQFDRQVSVNPMPDADAEDDGDPERSKQGVARSTRRTKGPRGDDASALSHSSGSRGSGVKGRGGVISHGENDGEDDGSADQVSILSGASGAPARYLPSASTVENMVSGLVHGLASEFDRGAADQHQHRQSSSRGSPVASPAAEEMEPNYDASGPLRSSMWVQPPGAMEGSVSSDGTTPSVRPSRKAPRAPRSGANHGDWSDEVSELSAPIASPRVTGSVSRRRPPSALPKEQPTTPSVSEGDMLKSNYEAYLQGHVAPATRDPMTVEFTPRIYDGSVLARKQEELSQRKNGSFFPHISERPPSPPSPGSISSARKASGGLTIKERVARLADALGCDQGQSASGIVSDAYAFAREEGLIPVSRTNEFQEARLVKRITILEEALGM